MKKQDFENVELGHQQIPLNFEKLKQVLSSPASYNMITEAKNLLKIMTQQCRIVLLTMVDNMIVEMKEYCDACQADPDLRNKSLYYLRTLKKGISKATNIKSMNLCLFDAEEKFDAFWDEIHGYSI